MRGGQSDPWHLRFTPLPSRLCIPALAGDNSAGSKSFQFATATTERNRFSLGRPKGFTTVAASLWWTDLLRTALGNGPKFWLPLFIQGLLSLLYKGKVGILLLPIVRFQIGFEPMPYYSMKKIMIMANELINRHTNIWQPATAMS